MRGISVGPTGNDGYELPVDFVTLLGLSLSCLARRLESGFRGLSRVLGRRSYRALPRQRTLDGHFANCICRATMFEEYLEEVQLKGQTESSCQAQ